MTATTTTRNPARPGSPAPKLIWANPDIELNDRKPMTGRQAINHVHRHWTNAVARITGPGRLEILTRSPANVHAAIEDLLPDLRLTIVQGDLFRLALEAAADGGDPRPFLLQLLATTAVTR
jgi:hypothetical protein